MHVERLYLTIDRLSLFINNFAKVLVVTFLAIMCFFTIVQVFCRYVLNSALIWPEELNVFLMAWITFVGSSIAIKESSHIGIDMFVNMLPKKLEIVVRICSKIVIIYCVSLIIKYGFNIAKMNIGVVSDALGISMFIPRISLVIGGLMMLYQVMYLLMIDFKMIFGQEGKI